MIVRAHNLSAWRPLTRLATPRLATSLHGSALARNVTADPIPSTSVSLPPSSPSPAQPAKGPMFIPPAEDPLLGMFTNVIMRHGKRQRAAKIVTDTLSYLHRITLSPPLPLLREAVRLASPAVKVVSLKRHAKNVPCPRPLTDRQSTKQAIRWILDQSSSEKRPELNISRRIAKEVISILRPGSESEVLKKKLQLHKLAAVNRCVLPSLIQLSNTEHRLAVQTPAVDATRLCRGHIRPESPGG